MGVKRYTCVKNKEGRVFLRCIQEYPLDKELNFNTPEAIYTFSKVYLGLCDLAYEEMWMFAFNSQNTLIGVFKLAQGRGNCTIITPRDVFIRALLIGAMNIILVHNHPSGVVKPSREDDKMTKIMKDIANMFSIDLLDHIIIGNTFYSYRGDYKLF